MLPRLYLVTDRSQTRGRPLVDVTTAAIAGGARLVQLREKDVPAAALLTLAQRMGQVCTATGARLLINDRADIAVASDAAGIHLPATSFHPADARQILGARRLVGVSAHSVDEARSAAAAAADFVVFGPVFDTPSKRAFGRPVGLDALRVVAATVSVPVYAIGGITPERVAAVRGAGAYGVSTIAAVFGANDPTAAVRAFCAALRDSQP